MKTRHGLSGINMEYGKMIEHRACVAVYLVMLVLSSMELKYSRKLVLIQTTGESSVVVPKHNKQSTAIRAHRGFINEKHQFYYIHNISKRTYGG